MQNLIIVILDMACLLLAGGSFYYSVKMYQLIKNKGIKLLIISSGYAVIIRSLISLKDLGTIIISPEMCTALMVFFWIFLFLAIYGLYKKSKEVL